MKNAFYFTADARFILKIFKFLSWLFGHVSKRLDLKVKVNFKFFDVTAGQQTIVIHISLNISRSKGNQTKKFGQLIECNMRNIFFEKSCGDFWKNVVEKLVPDPFLFSEKLRLSISLDQ